jgi:5'-3' exonuclease
MIRDYSSIALVDLSYLFTRNYRGAGVNAPPNAGANRTLQDLAAIRDDVDHVIVCLDRPPYLRRQKFPTYKAQRTEVLPEELAQKRAVIDELRRRAYVIASVRGYEADDIIATLARAYEWCPEVRMYASDKDIAQCITANAIQYIPSSGSRPAEKRDHLKCKVKFGVYPAQMPLWQALVGDDGDNIPGVRGIGEKGATRVVSAVTGAGFAGTLQGLADYLATKKPEQKGEWKLIPNQWEALRTAYGLVTLDSSVPLDAEALLVKPAPALETDTLAPFEGFEGNATPPAAFNDAGSVPLDDEPVDWDAVQRETAERERQEMAAALPVEPTKATPPHDPSRMIIGADPNAGQILADLDARRTAAAPPPAPAPPAPAPPPQPAPAAPPAPPPPSASSPANDAPKAPPAPATAMVAPTAIGLAKRAEREAEWGIVNARLQPTDLQSLATLGKWLHGSGLYQQFESAQAVVAVIHRGIELGLDAGTALAGFHMIKGKPSMSADLIRGLAKTHPDCEYFYCESSDETQATWVTRNRRHPPGVVQRVTYTIEEARMVPDLWKPDRNGGPPMWEKRPKQMLSKTASSMLARQEWESRALGFYCPEELGVIDTVGVAA